MRLTCTNKFALPQGDCEVTEAIKRYDCEPDYDCSQVDAMIEFVTGDYVKYEDHVAAIDDLKAEREADKLDAERWRKAKHLIGAESNYGSVPVFRFAMLKPLNNPLQGSVAQHFEEAIDAAIAQKKGG